MLFVCLFEPHFAGSSFRHVYSFPELKQEKVGRCFTADHRHFISLLFCSLLLGAIRYAIGLLWLGLCCNLHPFYLLTLGAESYCCTWSHLVTHTHTHSVGLFSPTHGPLLDNTQNSRQTSLPSVGFESAFPANEMQQT